MIHGRLGHALARVAHGHKDVRPRRHPLVPGGIFRIEVRMGQLQGQDAACGHGVLGIDDEVHQDLLDLARIGVDGSPASPADETSRRMSSRTVWRMSFMNSGKNVPEVDRFEEENLFPAEGQEVPGQFPCPFRGVADLFEFFVTWFIRRDFQQKEVRIAQDGGEEVVEIMGHPSRQPADGFQLLGLVKLHTASFVRSSSARLRDVMSSKMQANCPGDGQ